MEVFKNGDEVVLDETYLLVDDTKGVDLNEYKEIVNCDGKTTLKLNGSYYYGWKSLNVWRDKEGNTLNRLYFSPKFKCEK
ncbi:hypothetical protein P0Y35_11745 [Kiritimatiellaeota bacterium B1221]|nr:hypothetical protein [Kiritimatiellaeota bacterium B1221]